MVGAPAISCVAAIRRKAGAERAVRSRMSGRGRICDAARRRIAPVLLLAIGIGVLMPGWARADGGVDGVQAIALLNQQRAANGIPPITTTNENYAAAWCPDEDHGPAGGEMRRDWSPFVDWTADSSPWTDAPLHQISMYDPRMDTAGDVNVNGQACMGLGGDANQPIHRVIDAPSDQYDPSGAVSDRRWQHLAH
jgi:hypothetical protein